MLFALIRFDVENLVGTLSIILLLCNACFCTSSNRLNILRNPPIFLPAEPVTNVCNNYYSLN